MNLSKFTKITLFTILTSVILPLYAFAAPAIGTPTGTWTHGSQVTIPGSGFGVKSPVAAVLWDTVDNQSAYASVSNGATIPTGSGYPWGTNGNNEGIDKIKMSTTEDRNGSKCYKSTNFYKGTLGNLNYASTPNVVYISWWWKTDTNPTQGNHSSKFIRVSKASNNTAQTFSWTQEDEYIWNDPNYPGGVQWAGYSGGVNQWNFHEVWFDNVNKRYSIKVNGSALVNNVDWSANGGFYFDQVAQIGWDGGGAVPIAITQWMDDIYVDNTLARVMICNASTYAASNHCEMQIPKTTWQDNQIQITVNQGSFTNNSAAYLIVIDASGTASAGKSITFGPASVRPRDPSPLY